MSLNSSCMLVQLNTKFKGFNIKDKVVTQETTTRKNAQVGAARVHKSLISGDILKPIKKAIDQAKIYHDSMTLPYIDRGPRLLPAIKFFEYTQKMREFNNEITIAVNNFLDGYDKYVETSRQALGDMWNDSEYPHVSQLKDKFGIGFTFYPLPETSALNNLAGLTEDELAELKEQANSNAEQKLKEAMKDLWERVHTSVEKFASALKRDKGRLHESLVDNMISLCDLLPALNITNDSNLKQMGEDIRKKLCQSSMDIYRNDDDLKKETAYEAAKIADAMESYF